MLPESVDRPSVLHGECLELMRQLPSGCANLIVADPPYFKVKGEAWDRQWKKPAQFLAWLGEIVDEWRRILAPNGSLYCFASSKMAARVECLIADRLEVLNHIVWAKPLWGHSHTPGRTHKEALRAYFPWTERIIFAEQFGGDSMAMGESGYEAQCERLRGLVFEPLRAYLDDERERAGWSIRAVAEAFQRRTGSRTVTGMAGHWFGAVQWALPTADNYAWLRTLFGPEYLKRDHESLRKEYETLRKEYETLREEYEALRRPFTVSAEVPYTDVWTFPTVQHYKGKHPCEKPRAMMDHIIAASSRPGDVVLDPFLGSGVSGEAAVALGRRFIGMEMGDYVHAARERIDRAVQALASC